MPTQQLNPILETGVPLPVHGKGSGNRTERVVMVIAFWDIPVGGSGRFPRSAGTVKNRMYEYLKTPQGKGQKFVVRPISAKLCRVWRVK